jgi:hypothetical protein
VSISAIALWHSMLKYAMAPWIPGGADCSAVPSSAFLVFFLYLVIGLLYIS